MMIRCAMFITTVLLLFSFVPLSLGVGMQQAPPCATRFHASTTSSSPIRQGNVRRTRQRSRYYDEEQTRTAALKFQLTQKGLSYVNRMAMQAASRKLPNLRIGTIERQLGPNEKLIMKNLKVVEYRSPTYYYSQLQAPNRIKWVFRNLNLGLEGDLAGHINVIIPINLRGQMDVRMKGIDLDIVLSLHRTPEDKFKIKTEWCRATIGKLKLSVADGGFVTNAVRDLQDVVVGQIKPKLEIEACKITEEHIINRFNVKLESYPAMISLRDIQRITLEKLHTPKFAANNRRLRPLTRSQVQTRRITASPEENFGANDIFGNGIEEIKKFWLDYRLVGDPTVKDSYYLTIPSRGEISYQGRGFTNVDLQNMPVELIPPRNRMFGIIVNDFVFNSALYHAFRSHNLDIHLKPSIREFGSYMRTTCSLGLSFCVGDALPELQKQYPDHSVDIRAFPMKSPRIEFKNNSMSSGENAQFYMESIIFIYVTPKNESRMRQVLTFQSNLTADADINLELRSNSSPRTQATPFKPENITVLTGSVRIQKFDLYVMKSQLKELKAGENMEDLAELIDIVIEDLVNEILDSGLPLPTLEGMRMTQVQLQVADRAVHVFGDIDFEDALMDKVASGIVKDFASVVSTS